jgi:transposase InsO family protein/DNA-binding MarR family transcriptional regulator
MLKMASTLVDINRSVACKVRVLNPFKHDCTLKQDAEIGRAERIERVVSVLLAKEHELEPENLTSVRRIQLRMDETKTGPHFEQALESEVPEHLKELFGRSTKEKSEYEKQVVAGLLVKYQQIFSKHEWDLGLTALAEHSINTGEAPPIKQRPRRVPMAYASEEKKAIEDLLQKGVIQKSTSPWASPIVLVRKKSGAVRPCVDYRKINALVKPDGFPLPRIQDCLDAVAGSSLFSSFDLTSGYFQIPLKKEDIPKSAFCCKFGHFEMTRMPFGLNNAASTFQRTMELALQGLQWETCLVYIDDIVVFAADFNQHIERVTQVFERMKQAGLKLKPEKCNMLQTEVVFLGHIVSKEGIRPDPTNIAKILQWPTPKTPKPVKQLVATGSYYRRFVKGFADMVRPMVDLTKKGKDFIWDASCENSFEALKKALVSPDVMGYPLNESGQFILDVDASGIGIGGVLQQIQGERERVIAYASRSLNKAERNYCITEKELLAVVFFIQYFRQYLLGRRFLVRSDHQALVWLFSLKEPNGKIARWIEILAPYDFVIEYRAGKKQAHCDALSRCESPRDCTCPEVDMDEPLKCGPCKKCRRRADQMMLELNAKEKETATRTHAKDRLQETIKQPLENNPLEMLVPNEKTTGESIDERLIRQTTDEATQRSLNKTHLTPSTSKSEAKLPPWTDLKSPEEMANIQSKDPDIGPIFKAKCEDKKPGSAEMVTASPATRHFWIIWDNIHLQNGMLFKVFPKKNGTDECKQLLVPRVIKTSVLRQMHSSVLSGHLGTRKTKERTAQTFYWFNMKEDINMFVRECDVCAADKTPPKQPRAPLGHLRSGAPWDTLAVDYMGPFPVTERGNRYILTLTDHFTKYVEVMAVPNQQAEECATRIVNDFVSRWGTPLSIHSDQGSAFESKVFKEICRILEIRKTRTSPRNPKGNGQTERFNRTLLKMIRAYLSDEQDQWDLYLGCLAGAYRSTPNESTKLTPNMLSIGREVRLPASIVYGGQTTSEELPSFAAHANLLRARMLKAHDVARKHLHNSAKRSKEIYDHRLSFHLYEVGDVVWCVHESRKVGVTPKLEKRYEGPYLITSKLSTINFVIQLNQEGDQRCVHHDKLKRYEGCNLPRWILRAKKSIRQPSRH